jgi:hypothetical protein
MHTNCEAFKTNQTNYNKTARYKQEKILHASGLDL